MRDLSRNLGKFRRGRVWPAYLALGGLWLAMAMAHRHNLPNNLDDICTIFDDRRDWYKAVLNSEDRWGTPAHIQMAIVHQESTFRFNARPPRTRLMGFIPWKRPSNAYGFAQALDVTWERYKKETGQNYADRDNFDDAIDFVGWYTNLSHRSVGISKWDPYNQYLAYHEGQTGWRRKSYEEKAWLIEAANRVDARAKKWWGQLHGCQKDLDRWWWIFGS